MPSDDRRPASRPRSSLTRARLSHPALDFWVDVELREYAGRWIVVADLAGSREIAAAFDPQLALLYALWPLGDSMAVRMVRRATLFEYHPVP
jgi:hypothetical protein